MNTTSLVTLDAISEQLVSIQDKAGNVVGQRIMSVKEWRAENPAVEALSAAGRRASYNRYAREAGRLLAANIDSKKLGALMISGRLGAKRVRLSKAGDLSLVLTDTGVDATAVRADVDQLTAEEKAELLEQLQQEVNAKARAGDSPMAGLLNQPVSTVN